MTNRAYDFTLAAALSANQRIDARGSYLKVLSAAGGPVGIKLDGGAEIQLAEGQGWRLRDGQEFRDVVVRNLQAVANAGSLFIGQGEFEDSRTLKPPVMVMTTDTTAVTPGLLDAGWVSGSPSGLAASANVAVVYDLGPLWSQYGLVQAIADIRAPCTNFQIQACGATTTNFANRYRVGHAFSTGLGTTFNAAAPNGAQAIQFRPAGRYVVLVINNLDGANAMGAASSIQIVAYPT